MADQEKEDFRSRLAGRVEHGQVKAWAAVLGLAPNSVSRQLNSKGYRIPDVFEVSLVARAFGVSPAWLAFGLGPMDPELATCGQRVGEELGLDVELGLVLEAWLLNPDKRGMVSGWARDQLKLPGLLATLARRAKVRGAVLCELESILVSDGAKRESDRLLRAVELSARKVKRRAQDKDKVRRGA